MSSRFYLYGFLEGESPVNWGPIGMDGKEVFTLIYDGLAVAVSETDKKVIDPLRDYLLTHQQALSTIMKNYELAPVSFGTVVQSRKKLNELVSKMHPQLIELLAKVKNRVELGLKVFWTAESFQEEMEQSSSEISRLKKQIREIGSDKAQQRYNLAVELGEKVESLANSKREEYKTKIFTPLGNMAADSKLNDLTNEKMIINASFLVDKDKENDFDMAVDAIYQKYRQSLQFKYSGPWPAYSFTQTVIKE